MQPKCLDEEMLADYIEGRFTGKERSVIEKHLCDCDICGDYFTVAGSLVRSNGRFALESAPIEVTLSAVSLVKNLNTAPKTDLPARLKTYIRRLNQRISDLMILLPLTWSHPATVRSSEKIISGNSICFRKTFKEMDVEIEIEKTGKNKSRIRVRLLDNKGHSDIRVTLKRGEREISSSLLNRNYLLFEEIPFGHYSLTFSMDGVAPEKYLFEIKESSNG